ncbi:MAG: electron transport complex subunit RsxC [Desulfobacterales bacterium]|nr:electron transport complex subunit RsxC [Desulfobacterales bacterium]
MKTILKTFKLGGVHPPENKLSNGQAIEYASLPKRVMIPLAQNLGAPSQPVVKKGDRVKVGTLIGQGQGFVAANVHSSVSGKVFKVDKVLDASGYKRPAVIINVEGDEWEEDIIQTEEVIKEIALSEKEIIDRVHDMGIVGLGGATFPSHVKLMVPDGKKAEYLIINAVECEPYLTADHRIMLEKGEECLMGVRILMKALGTEKAIIGIENNKKDAIRHMTELAKDDAGIKIQALKVKYPQGGEKQLIKACLNREVPSGKLPIETGCVVNNIGTAFAVYEAIQLNKPLFERVVTITGKSLRRPVNLMARVGTPVSHLVELAGGVPDDTGKVVNGGPMMGKAVTSLDIPVVKGTSGILFFREEESKRVAVSNCIRCGKCMTACPMGLEPVALSTYVENQMWDEAETHNIMDCVECGSCQYTCPAGQPILDQLRVGKNKVGQIMRSRPRK